MNRTRWKIMLGSLGLSLAGLAAVAGVPENSPGISCAPQAHKVARVAPEPPIPIPVPKVAELPAPVVPAAVVPSIPSLPVVSGSAESTPALGAVPLPVSVPEPVVIPATPVVSLPELSLPSLIPSESVPQPVLAVPESGIGQLVVPPASNAVLVPTTTTPTDSIPNFSVPAPAPNESAKLPSPPEPEPVQALQVPEFPPVASPQPALPSDLPTIEYLPSAEKTVSHAAPESTNTKKPEQAPQVEPQTAKLKVILQLGTDRPKFEVRNDDEIYLKVTSDQVEVKSPTESGNSLAQMKASGRVRFVTPGGEGTCDELVVIPGTCQVMVVGNVAFTYNWGKLETTVTGEKLTFRLGATPGASQGASPLPDAKPGMAPGLPTSYPRNR